MTDERRENAMRFFDRDKRDRGRAADVRERERSLSSLTVIDVFGAEAALVSFLTHLDRAHLVVCDPANGAPIYKFRWASGYENGEGVRVQGVLDG
jgi:hypothetical protein